MKNETISFYASIAIYLYDIEKIRQRYLRWGNPNINSILFHFGKLEYISKLKQIFKSKILVFGRERLAHRIKEANKLVKLRNNSKYTYTQYVKSLFLGAEK
jgi:hypothetical protein